MLAVENTKHANKRAKTLGNDDNYKDSSSLVRHSFKTQHFAVLSGALDDDANLVTDPKS